MTKPPEDTSIAQLEIDSQNLSLPDYTAALLEVAHRAKSQARTTFSMLKKPSLQATSPSHP